MRFSEKQCIYIIDDDQELRANLTLLINGSDQYRVSGQFSSFEDSFKEYFKNIPDIVLIDIHLPGKSGIEGTRIIKEKHPQAQILILTVFEEDDMIFEAFKAGAAGYIIKSSNYLELLRGLDELTGGGAPLSSKIARKLIRNFHVDLNSPLTRRERQVLGLLAEGYSYATISETLHISKETSKTHIRNIYEKLNVNTKAAAIAKAKNERMI